LQRQVVDSDLRRTGAPSALAPGWPARLELELERRGATTRLARNRHYGPLRLIRALHDDSGRCEAVIVHPPGGLVGDDSLEVSVTLRERAQVLATTPGAQKRGARSSAPRR
jgi:urease accessory protein